MRFLILHNSFLDRTIGDLFRKLERWLRPYDYLLSLSSSGRIMTQGGILTYRPEDRGIIITLLLHGEYEPETTEAILGFLKPGMTFIDLGAHIGYFTLLAAKTVWPSGRVYAFEPVPSTCQVLQHNVAVNRFDSVVTVIPKAVSDKSGIGHLILPPESTVSARILTGEKHRKSVEDERIIEVETISLDDYFQQIGWPEVNLIKMDIEGAEIQALKGMKELSRRNQNLKLIIEINYPHLIRLGIHPREIVETLQLCGFTKFRPLKRGYTVQWAMPQDLPKLSALAKRMTFNLLCEKS
ncbi:FkbM family methyltransferase [Candidatus Bipolaricaulota sp. J31]